MLLKKNRVDRKTVDLIFKQGRFCSSENLSLKFIHQTGNLYPKVSFAAPKSAAKSAVKRNLLRRRGYTVLVPYINSLPKDLVGVFVFGKKSLVLFGSKKNKDNNPNENLENEIKKIISRIN